MLRLEPCGKFFPLVVRTPTRELALRACTEAELRRWQSALLRAVFSTESSSICKAEPSRPGVKDDDAGVAKPSKVFRRGSSYATRTTDVHDLAPAGGDTSEEEAAGAEAPTGAALSVDEALLRALVLGVPRPIPDP